MTNLTQYRKYFLWRGSRRGAQAPFSLSKPYRALYECSLIPKQITYVMTLFIYRRMADPNMHASQYYVHIHRIHKTGQMYLK